MFIRVHRLEIQSVMLVFRLSFVNCCPSHPPSPLPCVNKYTVYTYARGGGGYWVLGLRHINPWRKVPIKVNFLDDDILHCLLWVLSFYVRFLLRKGNETGNLWGYEMVGDWREPSGWRRFNIATGIHQSQRSSFSCVFYVLLQIFASFYPKIIFSLLGPVLCGGGGGG